ncbi:MAG: DUF883 domain-containing protein [Pseudomonadota bacterium]
MDQTHQNTPDAKLRNQSDADREQLLGHLRNAVSDAEQWLSSAAKDGTADVEQAKSQFQETLRTAKSDILKLEDSMLARGKMAAQATNVYVQGHPWTAVGMGAAIGVAFGLLLARK